MAVKARKRNTAMVFNPTRGLSLSGRSSVRKTTARKNPTRTAAAVKANPHILRRRVHRRNNPATASGLLVAAVMAGVGITFFDVISNKLLPASSSAVVRIGVKLGGAWLFQSSMAAKIPVLGKHKNDIALVLAAAAAVDALKLWVLPIVSSAVGNLTGNALLLVAPPAQVADGTTGNIYGNSAPAWNRPRYA